MPIKPPSLVAILPAPALVGCAVRVARLAVPEPRPVCREIPVCVTEAHPEVPEFAEPSGDGVPGLRRDGTAYVKHIDDAVRISTGERGDDVV